MIGVTRWNDKEWRDAGAELRRWKKMDIPQFVRYRGRVLVQDLIRWSPPRGKNPGKESFPSMKKRGEKTIERDGKRLFMALNDLDIIKTAKANRKDKGVLGHIYRLLKAKMYPELERLFFRIGFKYSGIIGNASNDLWSKAVAIGSRGRPARHKRYFVVEKGSIKSLIDKRKRDVGLLKSGWGAVAAFLGVPARNWPQWVQRHGPRGGFEDKLGVKDKPTIKLWNDTRPAKDMSQKELVDAAVLVNERKMVIEARKITEDEFRKIERLKKIK